MTNINKKKQKPYFQVYTKKSFFTHARIKYVDDAGNEFIRGKNVNTSFPYNTYNEIESKDLEGIDINDKEHYFPEKKIYLTDEQGERVKNKILSFLILFLNTPNCY